MTAAPLAVLVLPFHEIPGKEETVLWLKPLVLLRRKGKQLCFLLDTNWNCVISVMATKICEPLGTNCHVIVVNPD